MNKTSKGCQSNKIVGAWVTDEFAKTEISFQLGIFYKVKTNFYLVQASVTFVATCRHVCM